MPHPPRFPPSPNDCNRSVRTPSHLEFILPIIPHAALYRRDPRLFEHVPSGAEWDTVHGVDLGRYESLRECR